MRKWREDAISAFAGVLKTGYRPDTFDATWDVVKTLVCGQYKSEAQALWDIIRADGRVRDIAEVGRNLGGGLYLFCCAAQGVANVCTVDIASVSKIDDALYEWLIKNNIGCAIVTMDSTEFTPYCEYDFVYIDGGHTAEIVKKDIDIWRDRTRLIGFHDFADRGNRNKHRRVFSGVVDEIKKARDAHGWRQVGMRGRSEIVFETRPQ